MADGPKILGTDRRRIVPCGVRETSGRDRTLTFIASTEVVAMDGDIIRVDGWDLDTRYATNPQFLWSHNSSILPLGKGVDWRIITDKGEPRLEIDVEFAGPEQDHEFADRVYLMYLTGFLRAVSVGYVVHGYESPDKDAREELGLDDYGYVVTKAELIELSAVVVGSDPNALIQGGQVPREMQEAVLAVRAASPEADRPAWDDVIRQLPGEWALTNEAPKTDPAMTRADLSSLTDEVVALREDVRGLREDLRAGGSVAAEPPDDPPEGSERDPDDFYGLNVKLKELI